MIPNLIPDVKLWVRSKLRAVKASGPQVVMRFFFHHHHVFTIHAGSTHRHCGVSDCVARRLPYLRRAPRFQQVLGESPGRFGCHLLI